MLKIRWPWTVSAFVLLGFFAVLALTRIRGNTGLLIMLLAPAAVLAVLGAAHRGIKGVVSVLTSFTWWQGLWLLLFLSGLVFRVRENARDVPVDAWAGFRVALVATTAFVLLVRLTLRQTRWIPLFRGLVGVLAGYGLVCVASTLWSIFPMWTLYRSFEYLVGVVLLAGILAEVRSAEDFVRLFNWTWALYGLLLASVWLGVVLWPGDAIMRGVGTLGVQLYGVMPQVHANSVGTFGAITAVVALARLLLSGGKASGRVWYLLLFLIGFSSLILSQTRSAMAGFLLGTTLVLILSKRVATLSVLAASVTGLLLLGGLGSTVWSYLLRGESQQGLETLSGRIDWWQFAWEKFLQRPLTGYGAYAGGRFLVLQQFGETSTAGIHSDYVELIVDTGFWAVIPLVIALLGTWWWLVRAARDPVLEPVARRLAVEGVGVLAVITARSFFTTILTWHPPLLLLATLGYAEFLRRNRSPRGAMHSYH